MSTGTTPSTSDVPVHPIVAAAISRQVEPIARTVDEAVRTVVANGHRTAQSLALLTETHAALLEAFLALSARLRRCEAALGSCLGPDIGSSPPDG